MNLCISGYYGMGNFGDELFLKTFRQVFAEHQVFPRGAFIDAQRIDAVIIGGGDLIQPYRFDPYYFPNFLSHLPTWVYGVGIVNYYPEHTWPAEEIKKNQQRLGSMRGLWLRDKHSTDIATRYQFNSRVNTVPDVAFAYQQPQYPIAIPAQKPVIGVCPFAYSSFPFDKTVGLLSHLSQNYSILVIPVVNQSNNPYEDTTVCKRLKEAVLKVQPQADIKLPGIEYDIDMIYAYLQNVDYLISFKMHPSLVAIRNQVPVLCFSKMSKVRSLLELYGLEDYYVNYELPLENWIQKAEQLLAQGKQQINAAKPLIQMTEQLSLTHLNHLKSEIEQSL